MKKITMIIVALVVIAAAILVAVAIDGNQASAYSNGWAGGCGTCHKGFTAGAAPATHNIAAHSAIYPSNCVACHTASPAVKGNVDAGNCAAATCHVSVTALAQNAKHATAGCTTGCHLAATTTTTQPTTTTTAGTTTTTTAGTTTTTAGTTTTTTAGPTTTTTAGPTTTTVRPTTTTVRPTTTTVTSAKPDYTG